MASSTAGKQGDTPRSRPLHTSRSFSRIEPTSPKPLTRSGRASTLQNEMGSKDTGPDKPKMAAVQEGEGRQSTAYDNGSDSDEKEDEEQEEVAGEDETSKLPKEFAELPIELISLTDSFIDSLSAKVHPTPPSIDRLSSLFQDFYAFAAQKINTHIEALSSKQHRKSSSPAPSISSLSKLRAKATSIGNNDKPKVILERRGSEMLTPNEIADRKKARRVLELKRVALEEAVERRVCEGIYTRIWRHRSTQDEAQDEKLRSKTAALSVVGIGLTDLGVDLGIGLNEKPEAMSEKEKEVREWLSDARRALIAMSGEKYPLGKLHHLKAAYKEIVDTLSHFHPSSSADEIMPMMIYTLITCPSEGIDVISNLYFIQRFRNESKLDGEAAYCLTTLEAAVTFLETVDLATLRADEKQSGPTKPNSRPTTPRLEKPDQMTLGLTPSSGLSAAEVSPASATSTPIISKSAPSPVGLRPTMQVHNRRLSDMFQPPAVLGAAGDAVLDSAEQGFKTIGNSLENSFNFLVGKLKERDAANSSSDLVVPKTLDEARKLVSTPPLEDEGSVSGASSLHSPETGRKRSESGAKVDDKVLSIIGGRKIARDRSTDSTRSSGSARKVTFSEGEVAEKTNSPLQPTPTPTNTSSPGNVVESMRNLGNSLNPMSRIAGIGTFRGFGRPNQPPQPPPVPANKPVADGGVADLTTAFPDLAPALPPKEIPKIAPPPKLAPPNERFMKMQNPGDLRLNEVMELLRDYRRLGNALKEMGAV